MKICHTLLGTRLHSSVSRSIILHTCKEHLHLFQVSGDDDDDDEVVGMGGKVDVGSDGEDGDEDGGDDEE